MTTRLACIYGTQKKLGILGFLLCLPFFPSSKALPLVTVVFVFVFTLPCIWTSINFLDSSLCSTLINLFIHSSVNWFIIQKGMTDFLIHPSLHLCLASSFMCTFPSASPIILEALDVTVGLQWGEEDVEKPQADEQHSGQNFRCPGPAQLSTDLWPPSVHQCGNTYEGKDGKECDGERQCAWIHLEITALGVMVDGGDGPCHLSDISKTSQNYMTMTHRTLTFTWQLHDRCGNSVDIYCQNICWTHPDAQEYVYSIRPSHITDGGVGVLILDGSHLTGKSIWADRGEEGIKICSAQWILPGKCLAISPGSVTFLLSLSMWQMKKQPRSYFFSIKAFDSLSEAHWS